jgi:hypothetical protein
MAVARLPSPSEGPPPVAGNVCWWGFGAVPGHSWSRRRLAGGRSRSRLAIRLSCFRRSRSADLAVRLKCDVVAHLSPPAPLAGGRIETTRMCRLRIRTQSGKAIWVSLGAAARWPVRQARLRGRRRPPVLPLGTCRLRPRRPPAQTILRRVPDALSQCRAAAAVKRSP